MARRWLTAGAALIAAYASSGCCYQRTVLFPRLNSLVYGNYAPPMSPVIRGPLLPGLAAAPVPAYGYGAPGCTGCTAPIGIPAAGPVGYPGGIPAGTPMSMPGPFGVAPRTGTTLPPVYAAGGVPHDSVLLPYPTIVPPAGQPKVEITGEPKPMPK